MRKKGRHLKVFYIRTIEVPSPPPPNCGTPPPPKKNRKCFEDLQILGSKYTSKSIDFVLFGRDFGRVSLKNYQKGKFWPLFPFYTILKVFWVTFLFFPQKTDFQVKNTESPKTVSKRLYLHYERSYDQFLVF